MPTAVDLVTDLPADFEVFGQAVDTSLADLKGGTAGQFLKKNTNTDMDFVWANAPGKVLQVVAANYTTQVSSTSTSYADTGLTATITPSATTSKILVIITQAVTVDRSASAAAARMQLMRGASVLTELAGGSHKNTYGAEFTGPTYMNIRGDRSIQYLDSPATTSATTYKMQGGCSQQPGGATVTVFFQHESSISSITLLEIGA
jgi:hypothetical protein